MCEQGVGVKLIPFNRAEPRPSVGRDFQPGPTEEGRDAGTPTKRMRRDASDANIKGSFKEAS